MLKFSPFIFILALIFNSCSEKEVKTVQNEIKEEMKLAKDHHTYAKPNEARITHLNWRASVNFETKIITATAIYDFDNYTGTNELILDINKLDVKSVGVDGKAVDFKVGSYDEFMGSSLTIPVEANSKKVSIDYVTRPDAKALLWVDGEMPFLFTQSQAILARTWIPIQDSPGVRFTYEAEVTVREDLLPLMSATNPQTKNSSGVYDFTMDQPVPAYLMALAVGDLEFRSISDRTGVYATPNLIDATEYEFQEMDDMLEAAEELYGKYAWDRYDLLVLPSAFPFGGMENPRLTFATPTIIAGDRSLVALVAHELAHSWSGNLVTNATWDDFWLNEGFTVYFEQRIMEAVYGKEFSEMLASLTLKGMYSEEAEIFDCCPHDTKLKLDLKGRDPDDGMTTIPYDKGYFFLRLIEETVGREKFDEFVKNYFDTFSFQVMDTETFVSYLKENLVNEEYDKTIRMDDWIYGQRIPNNIPDIESDRIAKVDEVLKSYVHKEINTKDIPWGDWVYQEKYRFVNSLPADFDASRMAELDREFNIGQTGNMEIMFAWLKQSILKDYSAAYPKLEEFLVGVGRRKFLTPLYAAMKEKGNIEMARDIYSKARPNYHSVAITTMDELLN